MMDTYDTKTGNRVRHATKADHEGMFTKPVQQSDFSQGPSAGASSTPEDWAGRRVPADGRAMRCSGWAMIMAFGNVVEVFAIGRAVSDGGGNKGYSDRQLWT